jgi:integrase
MNPPATVKTWNRTSIQNLVRHKSGRYYARVFANGKETWKSLKTDLLEVAKVKLREISGLIQKAAHATQAEERGRMTVDDCALIFSKRIDDGFGLRGRSKVLRRITDGTKHYRKQTLVALWRSWPDLAKQNVRKISERDVTQWAERFAANYSATRYNNTLDTLRAIFRIAVDAGARIDNPAERVGRLAVKQKQLTLPEREQFRVFVQSIRQAGAWCSRDCADLVEFLAFTGARKNEAANVCWADVDFNRQRIHLRVTKGGKPRFVPIISDALTLLQRMRTEREKESPDTKLLRVHEAQKAMDSAAGKIGISRITHHDLRHLFATACIESGVDIPTVSRWLGHRDGGALAMRTYGHLRDEHSATVAKLVSFTPNAN